MTHKTAVALGRGGLADIPPKGDNLDIIKDPVILWQHLHQFQFHLFGILLGRQAQLAGNTLYMGIHHDTGIMINITPDHIGGLAAYAGQSRQLLQRPGNLPSVLFHQLPAAGNDVLCFVVVKARGMDVLLQFFQVRPGKGFHAGIFFEQALCHNIDTSVSTLGAEHGGNQQLPGVFMIQIADIFRAIVGIQRRQHLLGMFFNCHKLLPFPFFRFLSHTLSSGPFFTAPAALPPAAIPPHGYPAGLSG